MSLNNMTIEKQRQLLRIITKRSYKVRECSEAEYRAALMNVNEQEANYGRGLQARGTGHTEC